MNLVFKALADPTRRLMLEEALLEFARAVGIGPARPVKSTARGKHA
jgi:hypothetical protein